jgi:hypothetical protein
VITTLLPEQYHPTRTNRHEREKDAEGRSCPGSQQMVATVLLA